MPSCRAGWATSSWIDGAGYFGFFLPPPFCFLPLLFEPGPLSGIAPVSSDSAATGLDADARRSAIVRCPVNPSRPGEARLISACRVDGAEAE